MPKQTIEVAFDVTAKAVMRNDDLALSLTITMPYEGGRTVSVIVDGFSDEILDGVRAAFEGMVTEGLPTGIKMAQSAAMEATIVATRRGEI